MALATFVFPFLALFLSSRGLSAAHIGLVMALFGAGSIPAGPIAGWFADRVGRRPTLLCALAGSAALTALAPALSSPFALAAIALGLGVAVHGYWPAANAVVADAVSRDRYTDAYGLLYWVRNAGLAFSFVVGGAIRSEGDSLRRALAGARQRPRSRRRTEDGPSDAGRHCQGRDPWPFRRQSGAVHRVHRQPRGHRRCRQWGEKARLPGGEDPGASAPLMRCSLVTGEDTG